MCAFQDISFIMIIIGFVLLVFTGIKLLALLGMVILAFGIYRAKNVISNGSCKLE